MSTKPPTSVADWVRYLHTARAVTPDSPDYADAQEAVRFALQRIRALTVAANTREQGQAEQGKPVSASAALGAGLMHSVRLGEPIAELIAQLGLGGGGAAQYRQGVEALGVQHPTAFPTGDVAGLALQALAPVGEAVQGGTRVAAQIPSTRANMLARFFTGAGQTNVTPGLTVGAIQGFSAGGEDPSDWRARAQAGAMGGLVGAGSAALLGGLGALRVPRWLNQVKRTIRQAVPTGTAPEIVDGMTEASIRQALGRQGFDAPTQDRILATWRAGKVEVPPPPPPPTVRPGETITPIAPKGFAVMGPRATPPEGPYPPSIAELQGFNTRPRGAGGHSYSGTYPAGTSATLPGRSVPSPVGGPGTPEAMQLRQLQLLAQLPPTEFEQAASLFPPEVIAQLRAIRTQFGLGQ